MAAKRRETIEEFLARGGTIQRLPCPWDMCRDAVEPDDARIKALAATISEFNSWRNGKKRKPKEGE